MNSISVAVRFVCGRLSVQDLKWINEANFPPQQILLIFFFQPDSPPWFCFSWSNWPVKRLEHLADNWRGVFWFLLIYFADKSSPETRSPRRSNLNSNWVHLHRDLAFSLRPGSAGNAAGIHVCLVVV